MPSEKTPLLIKSPPTEGSFRPVEQRSGSGLFGGWRPWRRRKTAGEEATFSSSLTVVISMLGCAVGTGNIWRFPRIVANNATEGGALAFLIIWFGFLWLWSIPIILIEYGVGRFTRKSNIESFAKLLGPAYRFMGAFPALVSFCSTSYYSVLVGWCGYYFIMACAHPNPDDIADSNAIWDNLQSSYWPVFCHGLAISAASLAVSRGVSTIEPVNNVIIPTLLVIIVFCFYWALYLPYATYGLQHLFSPSWSSFADSNLWLDALSQNAWDTGAGLGSFLTFATFMKREQGAVKLGTITPFLNNVVSMICGIMVFCTVFSVQSEEGLSTDEIVGRLADNGPANTGLTFIWMPILFNSIGIGRFIAIIFFLCLTLAGLSSLIALMELSIHCLTDFGIRRLPATAAIALGMFGLGTASAIDLNILVNQDYVWAYAMVLSGCLMLFLVYRYGVLRFRRELYLEYGIGDWPLPWVWVFIVCFIAPIEGLGVIGWWIVDEIRENPDSWWHITTTSLATTLAEWAFLMLVALGFNWFLKPLEIARPKNDYLRILLGAFVRFPPDTRHDINYPEEPSLTDSLSLSATNLDQHDEDDIVKVKDIDL